VLGVSLAARRDAGRRARDARSRIVRARESLSRPRAPVKLFPSGRPGRGQEKISSRDQIENRWRDLMTGIRDKSRGVAAAQHRAGQRADTAEHGRVKP